MPFYIYIWDFMHMEGEGNLENQENLEEWVYVDSALGNLCWQITTLGKEDFMYVYYMHLCVVGQPFFMEEIAKESRNYKFRVAG
jgi:hypothetical protein